MCDGREAGQHQPCPHDVNLLDGLAPEKADHTEFHNDDLVKLLYPLLADIVHVDGGALQHVHDGCYYIFKSEEILKNVISQYKSRYKFLFFMKYLIICSDLGHLQLHWLPTTGELCREENFPRRIKPEGPKNCHLHRNLRFSSC